MTKTEQLLAQELDSNVPQQEQERSTEVKLSLPKVKKVSIQIASVETIQLEKKDKTSKYEKMLVISTDGVQYYVMPSQLKAKVGDFAIAFMEQRIAGKTGYSPEKGDDLVPHTVTGENCTMILVDRTASIRELAKAKALGEMDAKLEFSQSNDFTAFAETCASLGINAW